MRKHKQLSRLKQLTDAAYQASKGRLSEIVREEKRLNDRLSDLSEAAASRAEALSQTGPDLASQAGADPLWQAWADTRRVALNAELAQVRIRKMAAIQEISLAFGRDKVAGLLKSQARSRR